MSTHESSKTVTIEIDGQAIDVEEGSMVIQAADRLGIAIPRFCYHPKLSIAANCRMCLIDVERAPKPLPACATPVSHGMKVFTRSRRSMDAQKAVMEFLLVNHPLDCPICDQGGECELQDVAMGYGRSISQFAEGKRAVRDENLGPLVATDMTRCIHCTRCVRFLDEIAGTNELGGIGRGEKTEIKTFIGKSIGSELSGNVIDICPVGALTNKPFRYSARAWELVARAAVSRHDAVGSHLFYHARRDKIHRAVPRAAEHLNESWLPDRDRYSHFALQHEHRLLKPERRIDGQWQQVDWADALRHAADCLKAVPGDQLGALASANASMEEHYLLQKLSRALGCPNIDHRLRQQDFRDQHAMPVNGIGEASLADLDQADAIALFASNPRHDQPIVGHRVRQAWRGGAKVMAINPFDYQMHFELSAKAIVAPSDLAERVAAVLKALIERCHASVDERLSTALSAVSPDAESRAMAELLAFAKQPVVILGNAALQHPQAAWLRQLARGIQTVLGDQARLLALPDSANARGAAVAGCLPHRGPGGAALEREGLNARAMIEQARSAYLLFDVELDADHSLGAEAVATAKQSGRVVAVTAFADEAMREYCDVLLPLAPMPEAAGTMLNGFGELSQIAAAVRPAGEARPGWKVLRVLANHCELDGFEHTDIEAVWHELAQQLEVEEAPVADAFLDWPGAKQCQGLQRIGSPAIYDIDGMLRRAPALQASVLASDDRALINPLDAERFGWSDAQPAVLRQGGLAAEVQLSLSDRVPVGAIYLPAASAVGRRLGDSYGEVTIE
jgi:NADH-quinone oxidoreductase subunit G